MPEVLCECCRTAPVEEPQFYTKCEWCRYRLAKGYRIPGVKNAHPFHSQKRGRTGQGIHTSNDPRDILA